ncbi:hypothetical protein C475_01681 [Halosimplex carlsbadense 2-9-1]|uniref:DUF2617 family protein n=1 Tax=Halosimplex carlsbadense 2-9-1 TaxID=797114 RepID=M0D648_9EURY|nr:hypothetical protein [Halosimplex carlsbadense]ELZ29619.1 hypothetical protein C475_01681 [Halosimplex carlsbadense 2-9-1]
MTSETLQFVHGDAPPAADVRVFDSLTRELLGAEFTFRVVGSSHYVSAPTYDFHELSTCDPVDADGATTLRLDGPTVADTDPSEPAVDGTDRADGRRRLTYAADGLACATLVERRPLAAFPADGAFDVSYRFGEDAYTTIDIGTDGYETYHTYPEFDLALFTRTTFESVPSGVLADATDGDARRHPERTGQPTD